MSPKTGAAEFNLGEVIEKGKKKAKEQTAAWKGPTHKERHQTQKEALRKRAVQGRQLEKVSWKQRAAGLCAILFLVGVGLFQFLAQIFSFVAGSGVTTLQIEDTARLKQVLFGGEPWFIYCVNNETEGQNLPKVLTESAWSLKQQIGLHIGTLRCWDQTQSGRSVAQRFKLNLKPPLSFVVANGNKPRILNLVGISSGDILQKRVMPALQLQTYRIDSLKKWSSLCTSRRACVIVGHRQHPQRDAALNVLKPLHERHRGIKIVTLDTSFWQLKLDDGVLSTRPAASNGGGRGADVFCLAREEGGGGSNATHSGRFLQAFDATSTSAFLTDCEQQTDLVKLHVMPKIKARPPKPPKVVVPPPLQSSRPVESSVPPKAKESTKPKDARAKVDYVGSREKLESEEDFLFEAVQESEEGNFPVDESVEEAEDPADEVEL